MIKDFRFLSLLGIGSVLLLLSGCWIPENFDANVKISEDGSYTFTY